MFIAWKINEKDNKIISQSKRLLEKVMKQFSIDKIKAGRFVYGLILKKLSEKINEPPIFKNRLLEEFYGKVGVEIEVDRLSKNPYLLDLLYEELVPPVYRKEHGQFLTPPFVAEFMASWVNKGKPCKVLDPAVGSGIFLEKIIETSSQFTELWGFDIDPLLLNACQLRLRLKGVNRDLLHLTKQDFIRINSLFPQRFDGIICNPPYLNFHNFERDTLVKTIEERIGTKLSRLTNIYTLFFIQSLILARNGARLAFITPSEFLYTGYGEELKTFLLKYAIIDALILIDFQFLLFSKALTTAVITLFRKGKPDLSHKVRFIRIFKWPSTLELLDAVEKGIENPNKYQVIEIPQGELDPKEKWLKYFTSIKYENVLEKLVPLRQLANVDRGIATGCNEFFVLNKSQISKWKIEDKYLVPVISKAAQCKGYEFTKEDWDRLKEKNEKVYLLYIFEKPSPNLKKYIEYGEKMKVNQRYLTRHRSPWFSMEKRDPAKILATVFHREKMRFILNSAGVRNLTAFHCVYPKFDDITMIKALLAYLNSDLCKEIQKIKRREYGGGLHKFEPKDLEEIPTLDVTKIDREDVARLATFFDQLSEASRKGENEVQIRKELDNFLKLVITKMDKDMFSNSNN